MDPANGNWLHVLLGIVATYIVIGMILIVHLSNIRDVPLVTTDLPLMDVACMSDFRTCDIVMVAYRHVFSHTASAWANSRWIHSGVIYRDREGEVWVLEAANYSHPYRGVFRIPLRLWLYINRQSYIGVVRHSGPLVGRHALMDAFAEHEGRTQLDTFNPTWVRFVSRSTARRPFHFTCYEFTITLLQAVGVVDASAIPSAYTPADVAHGRLPTVNGHSYGCVELIRSRGCGDTVSWLR
jgi:hypothetical protein